MDLASQGQALMTLDQNTIGIDISKAHVDVFDARDNSSRRLANTQEALAGFARQLAGEPVTVVMEATGIYDGALRRALVAAGVAHVRVNPARARDFARASGRLAKTDAIDAAMLADMGTALGLQPQAESAANACSSTPWCTGATSWWPCGRWKRTMPRPPRPK